MFRVVPLCYKAIVFVVLIPQAALSLPTLPCPYQPPSFNQNSYNPNIIQQPSQPSCQPQPLNNFVPIPRGQQTNQKGLNQINANNINDLNQLLMNKILANPGLKTILDPNTKLYNQNGVEVPRQGSPSSQCPCTPNVVNNYILVPPEMIHNDCKTRRNGRKKNVNKAGDKPKETPKFEADDENNGNKKRNRKENCHKEKANEGKRRKARRKSKENKHSFNETVVEDMPNENLNLTDHSSKDIHLANYQSYEKALKNYQSQTNNGIVTNTEYIETDNKVNDISSADLKTDIDAETEVAEMDSTKNTDVLKPKTNATLTTTRNINLNLIFRDAREEAAIQDFLKKFPHIPEIVVRNVLAHMKQHLFNKKLESSSNDSSVKENKSQSQQRNQRKPNGKRKNVRNRRRRIGQRTNNKVNDAKENVENVITSTEKDIASKEDSVTDTLINNNTNVIDTTIEKTPKLQKEANSEIENERTIETKSDETEKNISIDNSKVKPNKFDDIIESTSLKTYTIESNEIVDDSYDVKHSKSPALGNEDVVPTLYINDIIPDYYPNFRDDQAFFYNDGGLEVKALQDNKHDYTTDRNFVMKEHKIDRNKYEQSHANHPFPRAVIGSTHPHNDRKEIEPDIKADENFEGVIPEKERHDSDAIEFQTPPKLETPDFETRRIETVPVDHVISKSYQYYDSSGKQSTHSNAKDVSNGNKSEIKKDKTSNIETVFAESKVAKYGQNIAKSDRGYEAIVSEVKNVDEFKTLGKSDENMTVVIAESIPDYWKV